MNNFIILDLIRGLAAIFVVLGHLRSILFVDWQGGGTGAKLFYAISSFGHESVLVFFVLSGFFISRSIKNKLEKGVWSWNVYVQDRAARIFVVLIPALLLTYATDFFGISIFPDSYLYNAINSGTVITESVGVDLGLINFISNLLMIPTDLVPALGSNKSLWSISLEFWCYFIFPLLYIPLVRRRFNILYLLLVLLIFSLISYKGALYFSFWLVGSLSAHYYQGEVSKFKFLICLFVFLVLMVLNKYTFLTRFVTDLLLAISCGFLIVYQGYSIKAFPRVLNLISRGLANVSYSLYAIHLPLIVFFVSNFNTLNSRMAFGAEALAIAVKVIFFLTIAVVSFWFFFERNTTFFKTILSRKLK